MHETNAQIAARHVAAITPNYGKMPVALVRGQGSKLFDAAGKSYIDLFAGFGGTILGHCHPALVAAITTQANTLWAVGNQFYSEPQILLAERLEKAAFPEPHSALAFFCHSGAEAAEAAIKLARLTAPAGRSTIVSFLHGFHGRTMGALSATPGAYQNGFGPLVPNFVHATYNDLESVRAIVGDHTAGILLEPIQGEGGMNLPTEAFMQGLRKLCDEKNIALIFDEVWTGVGRTGKWFGHQHFGVMPDIMTLGKALGGGIPVGAILAKRERAEKLVPGTHGCTLGGNPICAAVAAAVLETIENDHLLENAATLGEIAQQHLRHLSSASASKIKDVRGKGLMIGIELHQPDATKLPALALEKGLVVNVTQKNVIRLAPAITLSKAELEEGLGILDQAIAAL